MFEFDAEVLVENEVRRLVHSCNEAYDLFNKLGTLIYRALLQTIHTTIGGRRDETVVEGLGYADKSSLEGFKVQPVLFRKLCFRYQVADAFAQSLCPYKFG